MAKNILPVDFKDDIMNSAMGGKRRYRMINNSDGTVSFEDVTTYDQVGSNFGAGQMNATNEAVNAAADAGKIIDDIEVIRNVTKEGYVAGALALKQVDDSLVNENNESFNFGVKDGVRGFFTDPSRADDSFIPFSCGLFSDTSLITTWSASTYNSSINTTYTATEECYILCCSGYRNGRSDFAPSSNVKTLIEHTFSTAHIATQVGLYHLNTSDSISLSASVGNTSATSGTCVNLGYVVFK